MLIALARIDRESKAIKENIREYAKTTPLVDKDGKVYTYREYPANGYTIQAAKFSNEELEAFVRQGKATRREAMGRWDFYHPKKGQ
jgi:hypothetical protein